MDSVFLIYTVKRERCLFDLNIWAKYPIETTKLIILSIKTYKWITCIDKIPPLQIKEMFVISIFIWNRKIKFYNGF